MAADGASAASRVAERITADVPTPAPGAAGQAPPGREDDLFAGEDKVSPPPPELTTHQNVTFKRYRGAFGLTRRVHGHGGAPVSGLGAAMMAATAREEARKMKTVAGGYNPSIRVG